MCDQQSLRSACVYAQSDQSLCLLFDYSMTVRLLTEQGDLSLKEGCTGSSESTIVKMPYCWKSRVTAHIFKLRSFVFLIYEIIMCNFSRLMASSASKIDDGTLEEVKKLLWGNNLKDDVFSRWTQGRLWWGGIWEFEPHQGHCVVSLSKTH